MVPADPRACLRRGDAFAKAGDVHAAVREYLVYATFAERTGLTLKAVAVFRQVVQLAPQRRDVRRRLAEGFIALGLVADARAELERVVKDSAREGDFAARDEALERLRALD